MESWWILTASAIYIGSLFVIAWWADRKAADGSFPAISSRFAAVAYVLTLAIYNTSWSFYGSVGRATLNGFEFISIYVGPTLVLVFGPKILTRVIEIAKAENVTSIADFIAARYGKSQLLAAFVTIAATLGVLPYIALQLKAVGTSFDVLVDIPERAAYQAKGFLQDSAFGVAASMALFSIVFGVRHIHSSEHHRGLMLAVAFESLVKLAVFLVIAIFVVFEFFGGVGGLITEFSSHPELHTLLRFDPLQPAWISNVILSFIAFLCLPQAFHVSVVENHSPRHVKTAGWLYPLYLAIFSISVLPVAAAGLLRFGKSVDPDLFVITLPVDSGNQILSLVAFIGGLSAATGMVIVTSVALSTMVCNDVVMPLLFRTGMPGFIRDLPVSSILLTVRRTAVVVILGLAYLMYRTVDKAYPLSLIGLLSFVAVAQFGPAFIGGLFWQRAKKLSAAAGITVGLCIWAYTLLLPSAGSMWPGILLIAQEGPFGISWLRPHALFGIDGLDPISHAALWSLSANILIFVALSYLGSQSTLERNQAVLFSTGAVRGLHPRNARSVVLRLEDLKSLAMRFVGPERGSAAFDGYLAARKSGGDVRLDAGGFVDVDSIRFTENLLAGAIGAASARVVVAAYLEGHSLSRRAAMAMLDEASEALRFNRRVLQGALESVPQGICVFDEDLNVSAWNGRFLELLDLPRDIIRVGGTLSELIAFNMERGEYGPGDLRALLVNRDLNHQRWPYVYERARHDGTVLEIVYDRIPDGGYVSTYTDVTERHRSATALRLANEGLERRVMERTEDLARAKAEADRANQGKSQFLAAVSHDLLQPLNAARLFLAALDEELRIDALPDHNQKNKRDLLQNAVKALHSTGHLLDTLLDMSAYDSGTVRAQPVDFAINDILSDLSIEAAPLAAQKEIKLKVVSCSAMVRSDPHLLRRVIQNLLSNAIRYTTTGRVLLGCRRGGNTLRVEVWDTGPGISEENRGRIFQEFLRLESGAQSEKGAGLGLAIVQRVCRLLGHDIEVRSRVGRGSCFAVDVPVANGPAPQPESKEQACLVAGDSLTVLCLENEDDVLRSLSALLKSWGHEVLEANDVEAALLLTRKHKPDVALVDYHLDGHRTGLEFIHKLQNETLNVPTLVVTGNRSPETHEAVRGLGCELLLKPVKPASLRRFLSSVRLHKQNDGIEEGQI